MTRYVSLAEYFWLAEQVTGIEAAVLAKASRAELADSALHAPQASFGGHEFYGGLAQKGRGVRLPPGVEPPRFQTATRGPPGPRW